MPVHMHICVCEWGWDKQLAMCNITWCGRRWLHACTVACVLQLSYTIALCIPVFHRDSSLKPGKFERVGYGKQIDMFGLCCYLLCWVHTQAFKGTSGVPKQHYTWVDEYSIRLCFQIILEGLFRGCSEWCRGGIREVLFGNTNGIIVKHYET